MPLKTTGSAVRISMCCCGAYTLLLRWKCRGLALAGGGTAKSSCGIAFSDVYTSIFTFECSRPYP